MRPTNQCGAQCLGHLLLLQSFNVENPSKSHTLNGQGNMALYSSSPTQSLIQQQLTPLAAHDTARPMIHHVLLFAIYTCKKVVVLHFMTTNREPLLIIDLYDGHTAPKQHTVPGETVSYLPKITLNTPERLLVLQSCRAYSALLL